MQNQTLTMMMTFLFSFTFLANDTSTNMNPAFCTGEGESHLQKLLIGRWLFHRMECNTGTTPQVPTAYTYHKCYMLVPMMLECEG